VIWSLTVVWTVSPTCSDRDGVILSVARTGVVTGTDSERDAETLSEIPTDELLDTDSDRFGWICSLADRFAVTV